MTPRGLEMSRRNTVDEFGVRVFGSLSRTKFIDRCLFVGLSLRRQRAGLEIRCHLESGGDECLIDSRRTTIIVTLNVLEERCMARILLLSPYEPPSDGIAKHTSHLVDAWDSGGHRVLVISPGKQRGIERAEIIGPNSKVARILGLFPRRATWNDAVEFEPDIVYVQFAIAAMSVNLWPIISLCKRFAATRIPVVVAYHEPAREYDLLGYLTRQIYRAIARVTDVPIVFSLAGRQALIDNHLFGDVVEVSHGTTGVADIAVEDVRRVRDRYRVHKPLVLTLGFTNPDKGTDVLLDAASAITENRVNEVQFLVAGSPRRRRGVFRIMERRDVKCQQRLESQAMKLKDVDVAFTGYVADQDVAALLFVADVVALPYRKIAQSGIANLALSSRAVIVSSDLPGLRSDLGDAAVYVDAGDSSAMAAQIVNLLSDDNASLRTHMREKSEKRALANTFAKVAERILAAGLAQRGT